jgi:hypothetical protein
VVRREIAVLQFWKLEMLILGIPVIFLFQLVVQRREEEVQYTLPLVLVAVVLVAKFTYKLELLVPALVAKL